MKVTKDWVREILSKAILSIYIISFAVAAVFFAITCIFSYYDFWPSEYFISSSFQKQIEYFPSFSFSYLIFILIVAFLAYKIKNRIKDRYLYKAMMIIVIAVALAPFFSSHNISFATKDAGKECVSHKDCEGFCYVSNKEEVLAGLDKLTNFYFVSDTKCSERHIDTCFKKNKEMSVWWPEEPFIIERKDSIDKIGVDIKGVCSNYTTKSNSGFGIKETRSGFVDEVIVDLFEEKFIRIEVKMKTPVH